MFKGSAIESVIYVFLVIVIIKMSYNAYYCVLTKHFYKKYKEYLEKNNWFVQEKKQSIIDVFKKAGVKDHRLPVVEPAGYGMINTGHVSFFANIHMMTGDAPVHSNSAFKQAISIFRKRTWESLNPIFWIEFIIFLPRNILAYLGITGESLFVKIPQLFYWILSLVAVLVTIFDGKNLWEAISEYL